MSWLDDARKLLNTKKEGENAAEEETVDLSSESLKKELRKLYDNATEREIDRAIETAKDILMPPYGRKETMRFLRMKLED